MDSGLKLIGALLLGVVIATGCASLPNDADPKDTAAPATTPAADARVVTPTAANADPSGSHAVPVSAFNQSPPDPIAKRSGQKGAGQTNGGGNSKLAGPVTLKRLESLARQHNPTLSQAQAQITGFNGKAVQAGLWPNPTFGYVGDQIGVQGQGHDNTAGEFEGAVISQRIVTAGKLRLSRDKYKAYTSAAKLQAKSQTLRVHNDVRIHYYRVLGAERRLNIQKELLKTAQDRMVTVLESFNVGQANTADIHAARVMLQQQRLDVQMAENDLQAEWETLTAIVGVNRTYKPLAGHLEGKTVEIDRQAALIRLLAKSPELAHERAKLRADQFTVKREEVEYIPDVTLKAGAGYDYETGEPAFRVGASVEVPVFDRNQGAIQQAKADLQRQRNQVRLVELKLRRSEAEQYMLYRTARQHVEDLHNVILPESQRRYRARLHSYHEDRETWEHVLEAQHDYFDLRMAYTHWLVTWRTAQTAIQGLLLINGLKAPQDITPPGHIGIQRFEDH